MKVAGETQNRVSPGRKAAGSAVCLLHHPQIVGHLEDVRHTVCRKSSQVLVGFAVHVACQGHSLAFNNDVNAGRGLPRSTATAKLS